VLAPVLDLVEQAAPVFPRLIALYLPHHSPSVPMS
jgi:hypothetical protein